MAETPESSEVELRKLQTENEYLNQRVKDLMRTVDWLNYILEKAVTR